MITPEPAPSNSSVAGHYDELDRFYRELWGEHIHHGLWVTGRESPEGAVRQLVDRVADRAWLRPGDTVCDVGCGYGATARQLARERGVRVTGLTISKAQFRYARSVKAVRETQEEGNPRYVFGDWLENDLPPDAFDAVIAIECLSHMANRTVFFEQARRVLRPGGRLVACAWLAAEEPRSWQIRHLLRPICRDGRLSGLECESEVRGRLHETGFRLEAFEDLSEKVRRTWTVCLRRLGGGLLTRPEYREYILDRGGENRRFALALGRMWLAYRTGAFRYGLFAARRS